MKDISNFKRQFFARLRTIRFPFSRRGREGVSHATFVVRFKYWPSTRGYAWYPGVRLKYWNKILVYAALRILALPPLHLPRVSPHSSSCTRATFLLLSFPSTSPVLFRSTAVSHYLGKIPRGPPTSWEGRDLPSPLSLSLPLCLSFGRFLYTFNSWPNLKL